MTKYDILKEINYMLKRDNSILDLTENKDKDMHLMALGKIMALNDLRYSIVYNDFLYKKEGNKNAKQKSNK